MRQIEYAPRTDVQADLTLVADESFQHTFYHVLGNNTSATNVNALR